MQSHWTTQDPLAEGRPYVNPYHFNQNNPVNRIDANGMWDEDMDDMSPIYDRKGNLLGTDDEGLTGDPIIMDRKKFRQGMPHQDALQNDLGRDGLIDNAARANFASSFNSLPSRPDYDGVLTLPEAKNWYKEGNGSLYVDSKKIDLSPLEIKDFDKANSRYFNLFQPIPLGSSFYFTQAGAVYGTIKATLLDRTEGAVLLGHPETRFLDEYNFDYHDGRPMRNMATFFGRLYNGDGTPYNIYTYGIGYIH